MARKPKRYERFYFSVAKDAADMTAEELKSELASAQRHFAWCAEHGHGVSTKESARERDCAWEKARREPTVEVGTA